MNYLKANQKAWNYEVENKNYWTIPVDSKTINDARNGELKIHLTPKKFVSPLWCERIQGSVLALASGGGQQGPQFAAKGCEVTVLDNSDMQLNQDELVAKRDKLQLKTVRGDMRDLSCFKDESFDCVFNPVSVNFIPDVSTMYKEVLRVLKKGGTFFTAFANPILYALDEEAEVKKHKLKFKYTLPYSDLHSISKKEQEKRLKRNDTFEFSHTLQTLIGDLLTLGFSLDGFETDYCLMEPTDSFIQDCYIALMARKL